MFKTEKELCDKFSEHMRSYNWIIYPETCGWDLLLARNKIQVGVQAKLKPNMKVITQALPNKITIQDGPHYRAVLLANNMKIGYYGMNVDFIKLCNHLKILIFVKHRYLDYQWISGIHNRDKINDYANIDFRYYRWNTKKLEWLPPYVPEYEAGIPSPKSVTPYKIMLCRLEVLECQKGWICRDDVTKEAKKVGLNINPSSILRGYFRNTKEPVSKKSRQKRWKLVDSYQTPSKLYPDVFGNII
jgi:hypothetical protein